MAAHQAADLHGQFVAVLGHDLRNPLSAVQAGAKMLLGLGLDKRAANIATVIDRSAARMTGLIDNVLDFARTRLGGGLAVNPTADPGVKAMLDQVVTEMRTAHPDRVIDSDINLVDAGRVRSHSHRPDVLQPAGKRHQPWRSGRAGPRSRAQRR